MFTDIKHIMKKFFSYIYLPDMKIRHMILLGFMVLILFGLATALLIGPKILSKNMETQITSYINDMLNVTSNVLEDKKRDMLLYGNLVSYNQDIRENMNWNSSDDASNKFLHLVTSLSSLMRETRERTSVALEIIPRKGFLTNYETVQAVIEGQKSQYINERFVREMQKQLQNQQLSLANNVQLRENNGLLAIVAISRINKILHYSSGIIPGQFSGIVTVTCTLDNRFLNDIKQKISEDIHLTVYKIKDTQAISTASTIVDENGFPITHKALPLSTVIYIKRAAAKGESYTSYRNVDGITYRSGYRILEGENGNAIGLLEVGVPTEKITEAMGNIKRKIYIIACMGILIAIVVIWWIAHNINLPLSRLTIGTELVAQGDFEQRIKVTSKNEFGALAEKFNWMTDSILQQQNELVKKEKLAAIGNVTSSIIHDLKNPLTAIQWNAKLMQTNSLSEAEKQDALDFIIGEISRVREMAQEVLAYARGKIRLDKKSCDVNVLLKEACNFLENTYKGYNIQILCTTALSQKILLDAPKIRRVIINLADNARDAMPDGGTITIRAAENNDFVEIVISDTGKGISPEMIKHIFEPFFTHGKTSGTGLGLAICKKVIEEHRGIIRVDSKEEIGTTFTIILPLHSDKNQ